MDQYKQISSSCEEALQDSNKVSFNDNVDEMPTKAIVFDLIRSRKQVIVNNNRNIRVVLYVQLQFCCNYTSAVVLFGNHCLP